MRMLMKVQIPAESGNQAIKAGNFGRIVEEGVAALNAEATYFTTEDGMRTALVFFEMADSSGMPSAAEPFFMRLNAKVSFTPVMNAAELGSGVERAMA